MPRPFTFVASLLLVCFLFAGSAVADSPLTFSDDLSATSLERAVAHSLNYLEALPADRSISLCNRVYTIGWLKESLQRFTNLVSQYGTGPQLSTMVRQQFDICPADDTTQLLVTGYYEPEVAGSLVRQGEYRYPLYRVPPDLVTRNGSTGRLDHGRVVPYWTRREIEEQNLLKGLELVYLADPVAAFILHVQGSGRIRLADGSVRRIHFAAKNGRPYRSIGRFLVEAGKLSLAETTMPRIREYLAAHPEEVDRVLQSNQSFIFFAWGTDGPAPAGSLGEPLTAGRSVALDPACFPPGALGYLVSEKPVVAADGTVTDWVPMARFVLHQDSGSAIKGSGRLDLFWGGGHEAEIAAGNMKHPGRLYFLIQKEITAKR